MKRTQVQLPDRLFEDLKQIAKLQECSVTEVLRRGAEYMVRCHAPELKQAGTWKLPVARSLGAFKSPVEDWRELAQEL